MTREEAKDLYIKNIFKLPLEQESVIIIIDKIYDDFEQDLAIAASDKTCDGCKYQEEVREECFLCCRHDNWFPDKYEEK